MLDVDIFGEVNTKEQTEKFKIIKQEVDSLFRSYDDTWREQHIDKLYRELSELVSPDDYLERALALKVIGPTRTHEILKNALDENKERLENIRNIWRRSGSTTNDLNIQSNNAITDCTARVEKLAKMVAIAQMLVLLTNPRAHIGEQSERIEKTG